uniref:butyrophilin subfamily 1 member A1-like n=1 Tax=Centroberyx gerrardi TaxID=166262 RepID=UPI003AB06819
MLHLKDGLSLKSQLRPIVAVVGDDIILPCHLEPAMDAAAMTLEWARPDLDPRFVHVWRDGRELVSYKNPSYEGRTSLFIDKLKHGDISLKLSKVKLSDEGRYRCFIPSLERDSIVQLVVGAVSSPVVGITKNSSEVVLGCESKGWYPEPEVFWLDGEGNILSAGPTETVRGPDGLYTVSSRVTVEKTDTNRFTCRVQQQNINQTRETHIHVPDDLFPSSSAVYIIIGLAVVFMCIVAVVFVVWRWRRNKIKTKKNHEDETEQRGEKKNKSINNGTELQVLMKREGERDREQLTAEGEEMRDVKKKRAK